VAGGVAGIKLLFNYFLEFFYPLPPDDGFKKRRNVEFTMRSQV
jgi:hypothetical protein